MVTQSETHGHDSSCKIVDEPPNACDMIHVAQEGNVRMHLSHKHLPESELQALQKEEERLIANWGIEKRTTEDVGNYLVAQKEIKQGELVMIFPPYRIMNWQEVEGHPEVGWNHVICVRDGGSKSGLFSASVSLESLDNWMNHSCNSNLRVHVRPDYTCELIATRDIPPNTSLTFNYNHTEEDLIEQGVDFHCLCGEPQCVGHVRGKNYLNK
eukprot:GDKI01004934.1.p1 GENE.GDKI01004934.1~~GDKI01004934.1.p1  ORF type:complete len:212 (+),score=59.32 GDKI01004934.1:90-725(+)